MSRLCKPQKPGMQRGGRCCHSLFPCYWFILFLVLWPGCGARAQTNLFPEFHFPTARQYLQTLSQMVENQGSTNADVLFLNARLESQLGQKAEAERLARRVLQLDARRADIQVFLADMFIRQDRLEEAAQALKRAIEAEPKNQGALRRLGMVLDRMGDSPGAQKALEGAVQVNPGDAMARLLLGRLLLNLGQAAAAKNELERACQIDPQSINAHYALFQAQTQLGEQAAAQKTLQVFRELKKREKSAMDSEDIRDNADDERDLRAFTAEFHTVMANLLARQGQESLAEAHLRQALVIEPKDVQSREMLSGLYLRKGRLQEAKPVLVELVALRPQDVGSHLNLGTVLLQLKDPGAIPEIKHVLELDPKQPQALHNLARFYLASRQQLPEALSLCERLVAVQPDATSYDLLGWALYASGKAKEALAASAQAVEKDPANPIYRERYNRLKQAIGTSP